MGIITSRNKGQMIHKTNRCTKCDKPEINQKGILILNSGLFCWCFGKIFPLYDLPVEREIFGAAFDLSLRE